MVHRIILSTIILTLSSSPHQLQASSLDFVRNFYEQPSTQDGIPPILEIYPRGTFQNFRAALTKTRQEGLLPGNGASLGESSFAKKPAAFSSDFSPLITKAPAFSPPRPKPSKKANIPGRVMNLALEHLRTPYKRGGSLQTGRGTDCSGFVRHVYQNFHIDLPHSSAQQARLGKVAAHRMDFSKLEVGDLLFFSRARSIDHVGIYAGEGKMIHASSRRRSVILTDLRDPYYARNFVVAKRFVEKP